METMYGLAVGTPFYMPPEQAAGRMDELDERTDVYSVGTLQYEILTGQCPYRGDGRTGSQVVQEVLQGPPTPIRELDKKAPPELVAIAEKAMRRRKEDRYGSVADLADDLRAFLSQRVVSAYQTGAVAKLKKWIARNQSLTIVGLLTLATIVGALAIVTLLQYRNQTQMADKNRELNSTLAAKDTAIEDARMASEKERRARDEVNGLSLMSHSKNVRAAGDATLASLLALESVARFPRVMTLEALYAAAAEMVDAVEFDVTADTTDLAWSPDEKRLLAVHIDGTGTVWDMDTKQAVATIVNSLERRFLKCSFSRDGQEILTAGAEGTVAIMN